jgi:hypothetical protein
MIGIENGSDGDRLAAAIRKGDYREFSALLDQGVDVNCKEAHTGMTPLMTAVHPQHKGSNSPSAHKHGSKDDSQADFALRLKFVRALLDNSADINLQDSNGMTPLMHAVHVHPLMIRELLTHQPKVDVQDNDGDTALMLAAKMDRPDHARILADAGADTTLKNTAGFDVFSLARTRAVQDVLKPLEEAHIEAQQERLAAEAKAKADAEAKAIEESRLKTEQKRLAAEAKAKADAEAKAIEKSRLKAEQERLAAEAKAGAADREESRVERLTRQAEHLKEGEQYDLLLLHEKGVVRVKGSGQSITMIYADIENLIRKELRVLVKPGTYFVSSGNYQNMATTTEYTFTLYPCRTEHLRISAVCINATRPIPDEHARFSGVARVSDNVARFLEASKDQDPMVIQAGVWTLTDNYSRYDVINHLFATDSKGKISHPVTHKHCRTAKKILDSLGIPNRLGWLS